jgi:hypothetical protein
MRRPGFYQIWEDPDPTKSKGQKRVVEKEGFVCSHCGKVCYVEPYTDAATQYGRCSLCSDRKDPLKGLICQQCLAKKKCFPFERQLELVEARRMLFDEIGKL